MDSDHYLETASLDQQSKSKHPRQLYSPSVTEPLLAGQLDPLQAQQSTDKHTRKPTSYPRKKKQQANLYGRRSFRANRQGGRASPPATTVSTRSTSRDEEKNGGLLASLRRYPRGVFFVLGNEFCERFSFYGMRSILLLYLLILSPLFGSIAADNYFGRFRVILWVSLFYVAGHGLLSVGAIPYLPHLPRSILDFVADQFDEDRHQERTQFFSFFYFAINAGSLVAIMLTPILRGRVRCFGSQFCFPLAFGVPGVLMFGKVNAKLRGQDTAQHWLDYAAPKYSEKNLLPGVKSLVSILFVPIVFFWALFDQQGSTWFLQARRMDGRVGPLTILPDQMNTFNPLIIIIMVPIFEAFIYPCLRKVCNVTPFAKWLLVGF
uniref:Uncharacterized protein n=1 Tax=Ditylenchus dipsaci TaxID=166011 RepID=A0A915E004_9BILA